MTIDFVTFVFFLKWRARIFSCLSQTTAARRFTYWTQQEMSLTISMSLVRLGWPLTHLVWVILSSTQPSSTPHIPLMVLRSQYIGVKWMALVRRFCMTPTVSSFPASLLSQPTVYPPAKGHLNGVLLVGRW